MRAIKIFFPIIIIWTVYLLQYNGVLDYTDFSISKSNGWSSVITGIFFHGSFQHLVGNTVGLLAFLPLTYVFYRKLFPYLLLYGMFLPAFFSYLDGPAVIGISGLNFALCWFLVFAGAMSKNVVKLLISVFLVVIFGKGLISAMPPQGMLPTGVAWHTHLYGLLVGLLFAVGRKMF